MPVLLGRQDHDAWLTGKAGVDLLRPAPNDLLRMWPVSKRGNKTGAGDDDPSLIEAVEIEGKGHPLAKDAAWRTVAADMNKRGE